MWSWFNDNEFRGRPGRFAVGLLVVTMAVTTYALGDYRIPLHLVDLGPVKAYATFVPIDISLSREMEDSADASLNALVRRTLTRGGVALTETSDTHVALLVRVSEVRGSDGKMQLVQISLAVMTPVTLRVNGRTVEDVTVWDDSTVLTLSREDRLLEEIASWAQFSLESLAELMTLPPGLSESPPR